MEKKKTRVLIVGKVPPPIGGVTVFVLRLRAKLQREGCKVSLFANKRSQFFTVSCFLILKRYDQIIVNTMSLPLLIVLYITSNIKNTIVVDHNHSRFFKSSKVFNLKRILLKKCKRIDLVSQHLFDNYDLNFNNISVISPFLPPTDEEKLIAKKSVPNALSCFLADKDVILVTSAWRFIEENGKDLYGLNFIVENCQELLKQDAHIALVICIGDPNFNTEKLNQLKIICRAFTNIYLWYGCQHSWKLFNSRTIYIRSTLTDGNSVSIHEANFFDSEVLASDAVERPEFVKLFPVGDGKVFQRELNTLVTKIK